MKKLKIFTISIMISMFCNTSFASMPCDFSISNYILKHKKLNKFNKERLEGRLSYYLENEDCYERLTPLGASVKVGNLELVKYLTELGANINVHAPKYLKKEYRDSKWSPLIYAIVQKNDAIFNYLISKGVDTEQGPNGIHPIFFASAFNNVTALKYYIEEKGFSPNTTINDISVEIPENLQFELTDSLLQVATRRKKERSINYLLKLHADPYKKNRLNISSYDIAKKRGYEVILNIFTKYNSNNKIKADAEKRRGLLKR